MIRKDQRIWSSEDDSVLLEFYAAQGPDYCMALLPHRSRGSIWQRAHKLSLRTKTNPAMPDPDVELYPMTEIDRQTWIALNNFRAAEPANNGLFWRVA